MSMFLYKLTIYVLVFFYLQSTDIITRNVLSAGLGEHPFHNDRELGIHNNDRELGIHNECFIIIELGVIIFRDRGLCWGTVICSISVSVL